MSTPMWSRAVAEVVGTPLHALDAGAMNDWIAQGLTEGEQLDFKREHYGTNDRARRELAGDLAAFANHRGGVIAIGVDEDEHGAASAIEPVDLSDAERRRVQQIVAGNVFPHLSVEILPVATEADGRGVLLLAVAPSPLRPHGVLINDALRYPRRHGTVTRYLSESEVADLYRDRFATQRTDVQRLRDLRLEAVQEIEQDGAVWVSVAAVPTGHGSLQISHQSISESENWARQFVGWDPVSGFLQDGAPLVRPGLRRLRLMTNYSFDSSPNYQYAELHVDGSGVALHRLGVDPEHEAGSDYPVYHTELTWQTAKALSVVSAHAERVGAWGELAVEIAIFGPRRYLAVVAHGRFTQPVPGGRPVEQDLVAHRTLDLADVRSNPQSHLAATWTLLTDVFNAFGSPEVMALAPDGSIGARYADQELRQWAERNAVPLV